MVGWCPFAQQTQVHYFCAVEPPHSPRSFDRDILQAQPSLVSSRTRAIAVWTICVDEGDPCTDSEDKTPPSEDNPLERELYMSYFPSPRRSGTMTLLGLRCSGATNSTTTSSPGGKGKYIRGTIACCMLHVFLSALCRESGFEAR